MKKFIVVFIMLMLCGCSPQISYEHFQNAERLCEVNEGVSFVLVHMVTYSVHCNNGARFDRISKGGIK